VNSIVLLMADQWRWDTLYQAGHICQTPHLDAFAAAGIAFTNAYTACPLCTPARAALMTGQWPYQANLTDNVSGTMFYPHGKLYPGLKTYLERLRDDAGYKIAYSGKWHLGAGTLLERGITDVRASDGGTGGRAGFVAPTLDGEKLAPFYGSFSQGVGWDQHVIEQGMAQIAGLGAAGGPFCAVISTPGPHFPHYVLREFADRYADLPADFWPANFSTPFTEPGKPAMQGRPYWPCQNTRPLTPDDWRKTCQHYWAYCAFLDEQFGRVLAELDALGLADNTVVAFTADHGEMLGGHGMFDKGPYLYEEAVRIPMVVRDPTGRAPRNREGFANLRDLFPTLADLAGAGHILTDDERGRSFWATNRPETFITYDQYQGRLFKIRGMRCGRWKYNWSPHELCELYDLKDDPGERINLAGSPGYGTIQADLRGRLLAWMESEADYLSCAHHLPPPGVYVDGRDADEQHDHGWSAEEWAWFRRGD